MRKTAGFTLIEVLVVVAIVALLASIALPAYTEYVTRGRLTEAQSGLQSRRVELEQFFQDNRTYVGYNCAANPTENFAFSCTTQTATAYVLQADGQAGTSVDAFVFTLDQDNARATTGAPADWQTSATCWVRKKNGDC
jgi:type IV pilus assembly protein PilE